MRGAAIVVVEPEDGVFALVQAGWGVEVERLIRVWHVQCDQSFWRDAVYRVQPGVVDQVVVREIAVLRSAEREDRVAANQEIAIGLQPASVRYGQREAELPLGVFDSLKRYLVPEEYLGSRRLR
ncbi:hypothetical protein [Stenotrophomonas sp. 364]|uniref:hypothetical protein n=1 Tax=Stenotrophomonas sp. 364 TaxID=2691571 RepID=UPI001F187078|nr:hypothetical protein [Stenotrophomonas sp. 364]